MPPYSKSKKPAGQVVPTGYEWVTGTVKEIKDGDTILFQEGKNIHTIRLGGIDTPELGKKDAKHEFFSLEARKFLGSLTLGVPLKALITLEPVTFQRKVGFLYDLEGNSINERMVASGHAFASRGFAALDQNHYLALETAAKADQKGMWRQPAPLTPETKQLLPDFE
jgi:endonuclease YncB( thermonuclease family)